MSGRTKYDALVVGARCAGAATAMLMARRGLRVLAIDRGGYGADTMSTHALMRGGVLQLHRWGVLPRIVAAGTPAVRGTAFQYGDEVLEVAVKPSHGVGALYAPRLSAGVIPTSAGRHCVFAAVPPARFRDAVRRDLPAGYHRVLEEISPELAVSVAASRLENRLWGFAGRKGFMRQACGPGWALVGDAGYFKDPLTAHGITDALRDAELLAAAAARGSDAGFAGYAAARDELSLPMFEATDAIASFAWDLDTLQEHHQALNAAMKREVEHLVALDSASGESRSPMEAPAQREEMAA